MDRLKLMSRSLAPEPSPDPCAQEARALRLRYGLPSSRRPTESEALTARGRIVADLAGHPLVIDRQRALAASTSGDVGPRRVEDVLADRMAICARLLMQRAVVMWSWDGPEDEPADQELTPRTVVELVIDALAAIPYLWVAGITPRVTVQAKVPAHTIGQNLTPFSLMWWAYERTQRLELSMTGQAWEAIFRLVRDRGDCVQLLSIGATIPPPDGDDELVQFMEALVYPGQRFPDDVAPDARRGTEQILSELSFLNSPYVPKVARSLPRAERRRLSHAGVMLDSGEVHFIDLRSARGEEDDSPERSPKSRYHGRWIVRGHHRAQWFPSLRSHRLIWIPPYVKGPGGGPPMPRAYRVIR